MSDTCAKCGSAKLEVGSLAGAAVQLDRWTTMSKVLAAAEVKVRVCLDCGHIGHLHADVERLRKGLPE